MSKAWNLGEDEHVICGYMGARDDVRHCEASDLQLADSLYILL